MKEMTPKELEHYIDRLEKFDPYAENWDDFSDEPAITYNQKQGKKGKKS